MERYTKTTHLSAGCELSNTTASADSLCWLKTQIASCENDHKACVKARRGLKSTPHRLLLLNMDTTPSVYLVEVSAEVQNYTCLSHCWGTRPLIRTLKSNVDQFKKDGIPWDSIPKTFQDAISVTGSLGVSYIWIDSLCIVQDDAEEWNIESANMADIYMGACLTIGATGAVDSSGGLFFDTPTKHYSHKLIPAVFEKQPYEGIHQRATPSLPLVLRCQ